MSVNYHLRPVVSSPNWDSTLRPRYFAETVMDGGDTEGTSRWYNDEMSASCCGSGMSRTTGARTQFSRPCPAVV